ncbi:hypothetical protein ACFYRG_36405 [Streptomyces mirabilis]|uniref:WapI family immunity protein n=1 Tax=Streptomyces mirabilis TaxID=68239 RepID=UPI0036A3E04A
MLPNDLSSSVDLRPVRYQFATVRGDSYDDNWLVIEGTAATPEGKWSFADPCLLTDEARQVSVWLRAVAAGTVDVTEPDAEGELSPDTWFIKPVCLPRIGPDHLTDPLTHRHMTSLALPLTRQGQTRRSPSTS